jgi:hypothetical protein
MALHRLYPTLHPTSGKALKYNGLVSNPTLRLYGPCREAISTTDVIDRDAFRLGLCGGVRLSAECAGKQIGEPHSPCPTSLSGSTLPMPFPKR